MVADYLKFKGVETITDPLLSEQLENNVAQFFNWAMLEAGAYYNITLPVSGVYGGSFSQLRLSSRDGYTAGKVWEGVRKHWIWETGVSYPTPPINISGVYVNGNFQPITGEGTYSHKIDYWNGSIIFNNPIPTNSLVQCEYSMRMYPFTTSDSIAEIRQQIQQGSFRVDSNQFLQVGSGDWNSSPEQRIQLPIVIVDTQPLSRRQYGVELGNGRMWSTQTCVLHILAKTKTDYKKLHDVIVSQQDKTIFGFNLKNASIDNRFLNFDGTVADSTYIYPDLIENYKSDKIYFEEVVAPGLLRDDPFFYCPISAALKTKTPMI